MKKETKLLAAYADRDYSNGDVIEVDDVQSAVNKGLELGSPRFKTYEQTVVEVDGEVLQGKPRKSSEFVYLGVDQVYYLSDIINRHKVEIMDLKNLSATDEAQLSRQFTIQALESVLERLTAKNPNSRFISENGKRGDLIELSEGEIVFDSQGQQLWPACEENGFVKIHYPASDAPEV